MARQTHKKQEQLSFPELAFLAPVPSPTVDTEKMAKMPPAVDAPSENTSPAPSPRRSPRPRMVVVREMGNPGNLGNPQHDHADSALALAQKQGEEGREKRDEVAMAGKQSEGLDTLTMPAAQSVPAEPLGTEMPEAIPAPLDVIPPGFSEIVGHLSLHLGEAPASEVAAALAAQATAQAAAQPVVQPTDRPAATTTMASPARPDLPPPARPQIAADDPIPHAAQSASLLAALVTVGVLSVGLIQFVDTQRVQRDLAAAQQAALAETRNGHLLEIQTRAVDLLLRYNELTQQNAQASMQPARAARKERLQRELLALGLLDTLHAQTRGLPTWETTVAVALEKHLRFIREQRLNCTDYTPAFLALIEKTAGLKAVQWCRD